jgi:hypothetical protein
MTQLGITVSMQALTLEQAADALLMIAGRIRASQRMVDRHGIESLNLPLVFGVTENDVPSWITVVDLKK